MTTAERRPREGAGAQETGQVEINVNPDYEGRHHATLSALARLLRDEALARVNQNVDAWWSSCADTAIAYLASTGHPFSSDDLRDLVPSPSHPNQVGGRFHAACRAGIIRQVGFTQSRARSRHAGVVRTWIGCDAS